MMTVNEQYPCIIINLKIFKLLFYTKIFLEYIMNLISLLLRNLKIIFRKQRKQHFCR